MAKITESELKALCLAEIQDALGYLGSDLSEQRTDALQRYMKEPYGDEKPGRSSVVSSDVQDTVEWILPSLLRVFTSGDEVGRFEPRGPDDTEAAKQATEYVNWVINSQNRGFMMNYTCIKDALISKIGVAKIWWDEREDWKREEYCGLNEIALAELVNDPNVEVVEYEEEIVEDQILGPQKSIEVVIKRKKTSGRVVIEPMPPEEFLISKEAKDIQGARFVGHRTQKTISELVEMGYSRDQLSKIGSDGNSGMWGSEQIARRTTDDEFYSPDLNQNALDPSMRMVWVTEGYIRADRNDDGIAEMLKFTMAGNELLDVDDWEGLRPFVGWTPIIMPHRFYGLSIADTILDLAKIKTALLRQYLDGLYLSNTPRYEVDYNRIVDPKEVIDSRPGGIIRKEGSEPALTPVMTNFAGDTALAGMQYIDQLRENRTGVSPRVQGLGSNALHDTASGEQMLMSKAMEKIELLARVYAEVFVRDAFKLILSLACQHADQPQMMRLGGQWTQLDPRSWSTEYDFSTTVGLGNGDMRQQAQNLLQLIALQAQAVQMQGGVQGPLVTATNLYETASKLVQAYGLKSVEPYFTDPKTVPPQPPKPDPATQMAMAQIEIDRQKAQAQSQIKQMEAMQSAELETRKAEQQAQIEAIQAQADIEVKRQQAAVDMQLERERHALQMQLEREKAAMQLELKAMEAQIKAHERQTMMNHQAKLETVKTAHEVSQPKEDKSAAALASAIQGFGEVLKTINKPKRVIRGADGRVEGVE